MKTFLFIVLSSILFGRAVSQWWWIWKEVIPEPTISNLFRTTEREPYWVFDGVDISELTYDYKNSSDRCETIYINCMMDNTHDHPVCVWQTYYRVFIDFLSICDVDYENCRYMETLAYVRNKYGKHYYNLLYEYEGDDIDCKGSPAVDRKQEIKYHWKRRNNQEEVYEKREKGYFLPIDKRERVLKLTKIAKEITFKSPEVKANLTKLMIKTIGFDMSYKINKEPDLIES